MKHLQKLSLDTCVLVNNNLCGKLFSSFEPPESFDQICKDASILSLSSGF